MADAAIPSTVTGCAKCDFDDAVDDAAGAVPRRRILLSQTDARHIVRIVQRQRTRTLPKSRLQPAILPDVYTGIGKDSSLRFPRLTVSRLSRHRGRFGLRTSGTS